MAKKNSTAKDTELSLSFFGKVAALFRSETVHFVIGLVLVIFSVYLLLAFSSFFFTGAADQSIIDGGSAQELISTNNGVKNYAGSRGAQLASYLINDCFGVSSFLILVFLAVAGLKQNGYFHAASKVHKKHPEQYLPTNPYHSQNGKHTPAKVCRNA